MTISNLIREHENRNPHSKFFSSDTMKFFGERRSDMYVMAAKTRFKDYGGEEHECYQLSKLSRNHPNGPTRTYAFFDTTTFDRILRPEF